MTGSDLSVRDFLGDLFVARHLITSTDPLNNQSKEVIVKLIDEKLSSILHDVSLEGNGVTNKQENQEVEQTNDLVEIKSLSKEERWKTVTDLYKQQEPKSVYSFSQQFDMSSHTIYKIINEAYGKPNGKPSEETEENPQEDLFRVLQHLQTSSSTVPELSEGLGISRIDMDSLIDLLARNYLIQATRVLDADENVKFRISLRSEIAKNHIPVKYLKMYEKVRRSR